MHELMAELVDDGDVVAVGGYLEQNVPVAALLALIEAGRGDLTVVAAPSASLGVDLLVAGGCVSRVICPYVGFESKGPGPALVREVAAGRVERVLCDQGTLLAGLRAAAQGASCGVVLETGSDSVEQSPRVRVVDSPFDSSPITLAQALAVDVCVLHTQLADLSRNLHYSGAPFLDLMFAQAANTVVATADNVVPLTAAPPGAATISGVWVDHVQPAYGGARPTASHGFYPEDGEIVDAYLVAERATPGGGVARLRELEGVSRA